MYKKNKNPNKETCRLDSEIHHHQSKIKAFKKIYTIVANKSSKPMHFNNITIAAEDKTLDNQERTSTKI